MKLKLKSYIILSLYVCIFQVSVNSQEFTFENIQPDYAPPLPTINCIVQDHFGFLWIGTVNGLYRYDGYSFKIFIHNPSDTNSISGNHIWSVCEDKYGDLWIGTSGRGLNKFIRSENRFIKYKHNPEDTTSINGEFEIPWITLTKNGKILIAMWEEGLDEYDFATGIFNHTELITIDEEGIPRSSVHRVYEDSFGDLWVGSRRGLFRKRSGTDKFIFYNYSNSDKNSIAGNYVYSILEDSEKNLWIGTLDGAVSKYVRLDDSFINLNTSSYGGMNKTVNVTSMCADSSGFIWIGSDSKGLSRLNPSNSEIINFANQKGNSSLPNNITTLYTDASGIIWIGTVSSGLFKFSPRVKKFKLANINSENSNSVIVDAIIESMDGTIWAGTEGEGLVHYAPNLEPINIASNISKKDKRIKYVTALFEDNSGNIWIGTPGNGLFVFNPLENNLKRIQLSEKYYINNISINCLMMDKNDVLWIGTDGESIIIYDTKNESLINDGRNSDSPFYSLRHVFTIYEDSKDNIWIGDWGEGIVKYNPHSNSIIQFSENQDKSNLIINKIISIEEDKFGNMWFGSWGEGLNKLNAQTNQLTKFTSDDGLPNNNIYKILSDEAGNIWISTSYGIAKFDINSYEWITFDIQDGLQSMEFRGGSGFRGKSGKLYFGGVNGFNVFNPNDIKLSSFIPYLVVTAIKISGKNISDELIKSSVEIIDELNLSYNQNNLSFQYSALDFTFPQKNQYAYKMEDFDEDWIASGNDRLASYTNLDPGEYVLRIKGSNSDGVWNEAGRSIKISISPPPWKTWWAYTLYALTILLILYAIRRYELNRIKLKNQLRLEHIESEKLKEIDQLKSKFFENISHEFRTPLTLILGPIENALNRLSSIPIKEQLNTAYRNGKKLLTLINQLLDLSKLEAGGMKLAVRSNDPIPFLKGILYSFESLARQKKIDLQFHCDFKNLKIYFDREKMEQVFNNLISNAIKFTPEDINGKISVTVTKEIRTDSALKENEAGFVSINVKDPGFGISKEHLPKIFDRFYRANHPQIDEQEGTGIGLALAKEIIELHRGEIKASSDGGIGSEFIVKLRLGKSHFDDSDIIEEKLISEAPQVIITDYRIPVTNEKATENKEVNEQEIILIVEDNPDVLKFIKQQFESNYKLAESTNGESGFEKAVLLVPDLIISDVVMPRMNGNVLCNKLKNDERTSHIPVILLTAKGGEESKLEGLQTGADDYLTKPFSSKELIVRVQNLIQQRNNLRQKFSREHFLTPEKTSLPSIDEKFLNKVKAVIEKYLSNENFSVEKLAEEAELSRVQLHRKLKALTNQTASEFILSMRLQRAADLLKQNAASISEIAYMTGFNTPNYFAKCFRKWYGYSPSEFKNKILS